MSNKIVRVEAKCASHDTCPVATACQIHGKSFPGSGKNPEQTAKSQAAYRLKLNYDELKKKCLSVRCKVRGNVTYSIVVPTQDPIAN